MSLLGSYPLTLALALAAGCLGLGSPEGSLIEVDGATLDFSIVASDHSIWGPDRTEISAKVRNVGDEVFSYRYLGCAGGPIPFKVVVDGKRTSLAAAPGESDGRAEACGDWEMRLEPGHAVESSMVWRGEIWGSDGERTRLADGAYEVIGSMNGEARVAGGVSIKIR